MRPTACRYDIKLGVHGPMFFSHSLDATVSLPFVFVRSFPYNTFRTSSVYKAEPPIYKTHYTPGSHRLVPTITKMSMRSLRACMVCSVVQPGSKFSSQGCPNCEDFLEMRGSQDTVLDCTSQVFEGMITLNDTLTAAGPVSWVARWQRLEGYKPGVYAVKVVGIVRVSFFVELGTGC